MLDPLRLLGFPLAPALDIVGAVFPALTHLIQQGSLAGVSTLVCKSWENTGLYRVRVQKHCLCCIVSNVSFHRVTEFSLA